MINKSFNKFITSADDLITSRTATRAGFVEMALEKGRYSEPYIHEARMLKTQALQAKNASDLLNISVLQPALLTASGLSNKAIQYFDDNDKKAAIQNLVDEFLEPAGEDFVNELVYRFLLIRGDALGGRMRNLVGKVGETKFLKFLLATLSLLQLDYKWLRSSNTTDWLEKPTNEKVIYDDYKAIGWKNQRGDEFVLAFNLNIPVVKKNVDLCLFNRSSDNFMIRDVRKYVDDIVLLGEIKGGIDPAGADERWKTANSALNRIRTASVRTDDKEIKTVFVGAAIERAMSVEIYGQLEAGILSNAANLFVENQINELCLWIIELEL